MVNPQINQQQSDLLPDNISKHNPHITCHNNYIGLIIQVTVPLGHHEKCPVSVSFIARHGGDRFLLDTVQTMYASLQENSSVISDPKSSKKTISLGESAEMAKEKVK